jgi:gamma-glutamylcyclotransferase (GGCT)/AIG2-like uncharacterized protein YtfP
MANRKHSEEVKLYFAYGSNMNHEHMKHRCPKAKYLRKMILPDYELVFRSVADVQEAPGKKVEGALFEITKDCEKALDRYEGYPNLYTKRVVDNIMFYTMVDKDRVYPPSEGYLWTIVHGYKDCKISTEDLSRAVNESIDALDNKAI